jgi:hypothetical protein
MIISARRRVHVSPRVSDRGGIALNRLVNRPLKRDNDASWFRLVWSETRERFVAPTGKTYNLAGLGSRFGGRFGGLQHVETGAVQEEGMIPKNTAQLP